MCAIHIRIRSQSSKLRPYLLFLWSKKNGYGYISNYRMWTMLLCTTTVNCTQFCRYKYFVIAVVVFLGSSGFSFSPVSCSAAAAEAQRYRRSMRLTSLLIVESEYRHPWINLPFNSIRLEDLYSIDASGDSGALRCDGKTYYFTIIPSISLFKACYFFFLACIFHPFNLLLSHRPVLALLFEPFVCLLYFYQLYVL